MFQSNGVLVKSPTTVWQGSPSSWPSSVDLLGRWVGYGAIYKRQPWVHVLVNKIAHDIARLPLKVYERAEDNDRTEARNHPYAELLRRPNTTHDPYLFWLWTVSTLYVYGEVFWGKVRDRGGRPVELVPLHPTGMHDDDRDGRTTWRYESGTARMDISRRDFVHFKLYNPDTLTRGLSPLEPLRSTLENDEGARRANSALWRNGGRPSVFLRHPKNLSDGASQRLAMQWADLHGGVDNWAKAAVLEEGMEAQTVALNVEELQYVAGRKLNQEECCAVYDMPPPAVHILDRATFSNITEQMRSKYRDSLAPKCRFIESTLETELRDGRFGAQGDPDFGDSVFSEFLMDEVLRGAFEVRIPAIAQAIQTGQMTPNEGRRIENRPAVSGGDALLINSALVPITSFVEETVTGDEGQTFDQSDLDRVNAVGQLIRAGFDPEASAAALGLPAIPHTGLPPVTVQAEAIDNPGMRSIMGRLSRVTSLDDIDEKALVDGLNGSADTVRAVLHAARADGLSVPEFRERLKALGG